MKILKRVDITYKFTCEKCTSELEAEASDLMYRYVELRDSGSSKYYFECAVCKHEHVARDIPGYSQAVWQAAVDRFNQKSKK